MNSTIAPTLDGAQSGADPVLLHVLFATAILPPAVSVALSLLVVVSILLTLALEPKKRTRAMSFNLYLVFLSAGDLCMAAYMVMLFAPFYRLELDGTEDFAEVIGMTMPMFFEDRSILFWVVYGVLQVGAWSMPFVASFVCHEILKLLRNSKQRKRCKPPTLRTAALHGVVSIVAATAGGACTVFGIGGSVILLILGLIALMLPTIYPLWVAYRIFVREKLLRAGAGVGNRLRVLSVYFGRIVMVYSLGYLVIGITTGISIPTGYGISTAVFSISFVWGFQGWVSFGIIVTKPDVKKMVFDLLTGRLFRCRNRQEPERADATSVATRPVSGWSSHPGGGNDGGDPVPEHEHQNEPVEPRRSSLMELVAKDFIDGIDDYLSENEDDGNNAGDGGGNGGVGGNNDTADGDGSNTGAAGDPEAIATGEIRQESPDSNGTMSQQA